MWYVVHSREACGFEYADLVLQPETAGSEFKVKNVVSTVITCTPFDAHSVATKSFLTLTKSCSKLNVALGGYTTRSKRSSSVISL